MKPTEDEVKQAVEALKKWQDDVAKTHSDGPGCYILLRIALETQVDRLVDILLTEKPALGQNIKKECDELLKEAELVDELYEQNVADARVKEVELLGTTRRLISRLQQIANSSKEELSPEKPTETGGNATHAKEWGIKRITGWIVAKTSHFILTVIGAIVVAVIAAIVVDIFADFGWLQSIKEFIYNGLWPK